MSRADIIENLGGKPYLEQWSRIQRWKNRLEIFRFSNSQEDFIHDHFDFILTYFLNVYHLRDYLENSKVVAKSKIDILFKEKELLICRDICNESKHCFLKNPSLGVPILDSHRKSNHGWNGVLLIREYSALSEILKEDNPILNTKYICLVNGQKLDVFTLADKCYNILENFLLDNNLI